MPKKLWTAADFDEMSPAQRREIQDASVVRDLAEVPAAFLDGARQRLLRRIEASEAAPDL